MEGPKTLGRNGQAITISSNICEGVNENKWSAQSKIVILGFREGVRNETKPRPRNDLSGGAVALAGGGRGGLVGGRGCSGVITPRCTPAEQHSETACPKKFIEKCTLAFLPRPR